MPPTTIELGIDTFGDMTVDPDGVPQHPARVIRDVVDQAVLAERVGAALAETAAEAVPVLWVTHLGVVRAARALRGQAAPWESRLGFGQWTRLPDPGQR